jgi:hypothetical protein
LQQRLMATVASRKVIITEATFVTIRFRYPRYLR